MEITGYDKKQLEEFISSTEFMAMDILPITRHRALSHIHNPHAGENDLLLFIARENNRMIAYAGVLADEIILEGKKEKCGWFSLFWVHPDFRGKGIGKKMMEHVITQWNEKLLVADYVPATKNIYSRTGKFSDLSPKEGWRCFLYFNLAEVLPPKNKFFTVIRPLLGFADLFLNLFAGIRFLFIRSKKSSDSVTEIKFAEEKHQAIIDRHNNSAFKKTVNELNWIKNFPWVLSPENEKEMKRFHFSSYANYFFTGIYEIKSENKISGLMMITIKNGHLKIPYFFGDRNAATVATGFIVSEMRNKHLSMATVFHSEICEELKKTKGVFVAKRNFKRHYLISKTFGTTNIKLNDGDGDCGFT
ncbi:MAG: GNAT family N-acetyltransferase [Bacteroidota bacterium]